MNKKIMKAVLAIAIVFLVAAMPISGMIGNGIVGMAKGDEPAGGIVGNVAPVVETAMTTGGDTVVYNSGSDSLTFNASIRDRNREDDIGVVDSTPSTCWFNISSVTTGNFTNYTIKIAATSLSSGQANMYNSSGAPADGILVLSSTIDDSTKGFQWTCPATWGVGTNYYGNLTITDNNGLSCLTSIQFEVKAAVKIIGIYNYTGLAVFTDSPFYWNFTTTYPGTLNVTSGNMSYSYSTSPETNYGYNNITGRQWSYWIVVNNTGGAVGQCFNISFSTGGFTNTSSPGTPIPTSDYIRFENYTTTVLTWANNNTAPDAAKPSGFLGTTYYVKDGANKYGITGDTTANAKVQFRFNTGSENIWIRFMVDTPDPCRDVTYTCTYSMTA
jgi:hypothetical protein